MNSFGLLFYNSLLAIPFVFLMVLLFGETTYVMEYSHLYDSDFMVATFAIQH